MIRALTLAMLLAAWRARSRADLAAHAEDSGYHEGSVRGFYVVISDPLPSMAEARQCGINGRTRMVRDHRAALSAHPETSRIRWNRS